MKALVIALLLTVGVVSLQAYPPGTVKFQWGTLGDIPVPGDYDRDGHADLTVWRPSTGVWYILTSRSGYTTAVGIQFGQLGDVPLAADFNGDGWLDLAVFRPSTGVWYFNTTTLAEAF